MTWPTDVQPPPDPAGNGILIISYNVGANLHRCKVHIQPVDTSAVIATGGNPDYNYSSSGGSTFFGVTFGGSEATVQATAVALIGKLKNYYDNTTDFSIAGLYNVTNLGPVPVFPTPQLGAEQGTVNQSGGITDSNFTSDLAGEAQFVQTRFRLHTRGGGRAALNLTGAGGRPLQQPQPVTAAAGGLLLPSLYTGLDHLLVAYLVGTGTRILGHDGNPLALPARVHAGVNLATRRLVGWA